MPENAPLPALMQKAFATASKTWKTVMNEDAMNSREKILKNIRSALKTPSEIPAPPADLDQKIQTKVDEATPKTAEQLTAQFKEELEKVSGEFHAVKNVKQAAQVLHDIIAENNILQIAVAGGELTQQVVTATGKLRKTIEWIDPMSFKNEQRTNELAAIGTALVEPSFAIADIGALAFTYNASRTTLPHFLADTIIAVIPGNTLVANQFELFDKMPAADARDMFMVAGPSRTADIEKVLVLGAHGPRRLVVVFIG
ncbi:hypothetical protein GF337_20710 [candidate division KSB1 bacterium]|nr:hypothetical protein [candidate division KSB1 bacterium]